MENIIDPTGAQIDAYKVTKNLPDLTAIQARVLGTLMEKARAGQLPPDVEFAAARVQSKKQPFSKYGAYGSRRIFCLSSYEINS